MFKRKISAHWIIGLCVFVLACETKPGPVDEGTIQYDITYTNLGEDNLLMSVLPETLEFSFKDNNTVTTIEGFFGIFALRQIFNKEHMTYATTLKMMGKKYIYEIEAIKFREEFPEMKNPRIELVDETKIIAGYECMKALAWFGENEDPVEIYYTTKLNVENPNAYNPYKNIQGVLMQFKLNINNMDMLLVATDVRPESIEQGAFNVPPGYKPVTKKELEKLVESLSLEDMN